MAGQESHIRDGCGSFHGSDIRVLLVGGSELSENEVELCVGDGVAEGAQVGSPAGGPTGGRQ